MKKNIQAFPQLESGYKGMTLLDYFAGQVLSGMPDTSFSDSKCAMICYDMAQAMIEEREKRNEQ